MKIYEEEGITSINLGTSTQRVDESYYLLKSMLQEQHPEVVVLDASGLFNELSDRTSFRRYLLDSLPLGSLKLELAQSYAKGEDSDGIAAALIPLLEYHSAWDEITSSSFKIEKRTDDYWMGYQSGTKIVAASMTQEQIDEEAEAIKKRTEAYSIIISNGEMHETEYEDVLYDPEIPEENITYLKKIKALCEENGSELLLTKIPTRMNMIDYSGAWTISKSNVVRKVAEKLEIPFWDMTYESDIELDYATDSQDGGPHLNIRGAEKATECLEKYLIMNYALEDRKNTYYDELLEKYKKAREVAYLRVETDAESYLKRLCEMNNITVIITAKNNWVGGLTEQDYDLMQKLGLQLAEDAQIGDAYVAVINDGKPVYEEVSNRKIEYEYHYDEDTQADICSAGYYYHGKGTRIDMNNKEYSADGIGLNIVVIYNDTNQVIDSVNIETETEEKPLVHYTKVTTMPDIE